TSVCTATRTASSSSALRTPRSSWPPQPARRRRNQEIASEFVVFKWKIRRSFRRAVATPPPGLRQPGWATQIARLPRTLRWKARWPTLAEQRLGGASSAGAHPATPTVSSISAPGTPRDDPGGQMMITNALASVAVNNVEDAAKWYARLLDRSGKRPM